VESLALRLARLGKLHLTHASPEPIPKQRAFIDDGLSFEVLVARKRERFTNPVDGLRGLFLVLLPFACCAHHGFGLMTDSAASFRCAAITSAGK
jgi:hypothetical protein